MQNFFTSFKLLSLMLIDQRWWLFIAPKHAALRINFGSARAFFGTRPLILGLPSAFGAAMVGGLFSADAWACVTFTAAEVRNPRRDLPLALAFGDRSGDPALHHDQSFLHGRTAGERRAAAAASSGAGSRTPRVDRVAAAAMEMVWGEPRARSSRRSGDGLDLRMRQRADPHRSARHLCDGPGRRVLRLAPAGSIAPWCRRSRW